MWLYGLEPFMASYHHVKFSSHWHCGSGYMLLVAKQKESRCSHYCFSRKNMDWRHTAYYINNSNPGHTRLKQQLNKNLNNFCQSFQKRLQVKLKKKTRMEIANLFPLHAYVIKMKRSKNIDLKFLLKLANNYHEVNEWYRNTKRSLIFMKPGLLGTEEAYKIFVS